MAQEPNEQQQTDAARIPDADTGKLDQDEREVVEGVAPQGGEQHDVETDVETIEGELDKKSDREGAAH